MMKSIHLLLFLFLITCISGQTSFTIKENSAWKIDKVINVKSRLYERMPEDETYTLFVKGDTIINSQTYFKLYKSGIIYFDNPLEYTSKYSGAIRQTGSKLYYVAETKENEELLYDFDVQVGDTIKGLIAKGRKVEDIQLLSDGRKKIIVKRSFYHAMDAYILEGIGSSGGLLNEPPVGHYMANDSYLVCYSEDGNSKYSGIDYFDCGCLSKPSRFPINPNGQWKINYFLTGYENATKEGDERYTYYIINDTIINDFKYYKLFKKGVAYYDTPFYFDSVYVGAIRDEGNKFFYLNKDESTSKILLDFNVKEGDVITAEIGNGFTVRSVTFLPDGRRKIFAGPEFTAGCTPVPDIIEGIGHTGGIMETPPCEHPGFNIHRLNCYLINDSVVYTKPGGTTDCKKDTHIPSFPDAELKISPNPTARFLDLEWNSSVSNVRVALFNIEGKQVLLKKVNGINATNLDLSGLNKGMYMLRFESSGSIIVNKKIIKE